MRSADIPQDQGGAHDQQPLYSKRLAYLMTTYPAVSHTFIRRELMEIERRGHTVTRLAIRSAEPYPMDHLDREEQSRTVHCLSQPISRLLFAQIRTLITRPFAYIRTLVLAIKMGWRSNRGFLRHLAYLAEAAYFIQILRQSEVDHVHAHFATNATAVARLIRRLGGPSYSFTAHGIDLFDAPHSLDIRGKVADAEFVVGVCDFTTAQLRRWAWQEDWSKIHVVRCAVRDEAFRDARPIDPESNRLVCVGRLSPEKGQALLIDAFNTLVLAGLNVRLVLVGDGECRPALERQIARHGLCECVEITGYVGEAEVRNHILKARALVLPSFAEGLPVVIMESFALQRPVISTYVSGIPELVRAGENGWLVPAGNTKELTTAMREAIEAPVDRLRAMGLRGRDRVRERHYLHTEIAILDALFRGAAAPAVVPPSLS